MEIEQLEKSIQEARNLSKSLRSDGVAVMASDPMLAIAALAQADKLDVWTEKLNTAIAALNKAVTAMDEADSIGRTTQLAWLQSVKDRRATLNK